MERLAAAYSPLPSSAPQGRLFQISLFSVSAQWGFWRKRQENRSPPVFAAPGTSLSFARAHSVSSHPPTTLAVLFFLVPGCLSSRSAMFTLIFPCRCPTSPPFGTSWLPYDLSTLVSSSKVVQRFCLCKFGRFIQLSTSLSRNHTSLSFISIFNCGKIYVKHKVNHPNYS